MRLGVISDTHGHWDPAIAGHFTGVGHILHAGDIGFCSILNELEKIAPVTAVIGNTDDLLRLPEVASVTLDGKRFVVRHIVNPWAVDERLECLIGGERPAAVVFGHTHKPFNEVVNGTLFFNPGYAGRPRVNQPRSVAVLEWRDGGPLIATHLELD